MKKWSRKASSCQDAACKTPHAKHKAAGLCVNCYLRLRYKRSPKLRAKWRDYNRKYRAKNPDKFKQHSNAYARKWAAANKAKVREYQIKSKYGVVALEAWRNKPETCEVSGCCNRAEVIDHDHGTGKFRGVICRQCNSALWHGTPPEVHAGRAKYLKRRIR